MEKTSPQMDEIVDGLKTYVNTVMELAKLNAEKKGAKIASKAIIQFVVAVFVGFALLFASLAIAFIFSEYFDNLYMGFLIVAGFYLVITLFICVVRDKWLKRVIADRIIKAIYSH